MESEIRRLFKMVDGDDLCRTMYGFAGVESKCFGSESGRVLVTQIGADGRRRKLRVRKVRRELTENRLQIDIDCRLARWYSEQKNH
jgi:hypothetical protein